MSEEREIGNLQTVYYCRHTRCGRSKYTPFPSFEKLCNHTINNHGRIVCPECTNKIHLRCYPAHFEGIHAHLIPDRDKRKKLVEERKENRKSELREYYHHNKHVLLNDS